MSKDSTKAPSSAQNNTQKTRSGQSQTPSMPSDKKSMGAPEPKGKNK